MSPPSPVVIALVSGKGGVGKTMLSVAIAKELALSNRTLIIDLDFFNRGLTGLMEDQETMCEIDKPGFLLEDTTHASTKRVRNVNANAWFWTVMGALITRHSRRVCFPTTASWFLSRIASLSMEPRIFFGN